MMHWRERFARISVTALLALALVMLGHGHRTMLTEPVDLTAYAMPDGSLPVLCQDGTGQADDGAAQPPCPACTLTAALIAPDAVVLPPLVLAATLADWPTPARLFTQDTAPRAPPARGPPAGFLI